jgi:septum formation protein
LDETRLILASASPRRRELLGLLGLDFEVVVTEISELIEGDPEVLVVENALRKARSVSDSEALVLGVDTDVVLDGRLLGKPGDGGEATARLRDLSGRTHEVLSGIALVGSGETLTELVRTEVTFRELADREIEAYVGSREWNDRAGGYSVQGLGSSFVARIEGDLSNVIGLPIPALCRMIEDLQYRK